MRYKFTALVTGLIIGWWSAWLLINQMVKQSYAQLEAAGNDTWLQAKLEIPDDIGKVALMLLGGSAVLVLIAFAAEFAAKKK